MDGSKHEIEGSIDKNPGLVAVGFLFSITSFLLLIVGSVVQRQNFYSGILITEFILILMPPFVLLIMRKYDIRRVLRLNRISFLNLFIIFFIMLFSLWIVAIVNLLNLWIINRIFGQTILPSIPVANTGPQLLAHILIIGGSAGICEEVLFRGVIQRSFERFGILLSIILSGVLFGLFHMDFQRFIRTFLLGMLIGFIVYRTNSLYGGIFAHFVNNSLAVLISFIGGRLNSFGNIMQTNEMDMSGYFAMHENLPSFQLVGIIMVWIVIALLCGAALAGLIYALVNNTSSHRVEKKTRPRKILPVILAFSPGLLAIVTVNILIGLRLSGIQIDISYFLRLLGS